MNIAIIPARGGSKRIHRKNIKIFNGKPIIAWSIEVAIASNLFERIIVSTDDLEIANIARAYGAEVPFMRPMELANDYASTLDVMSHATQWALKENLSVSAICCIYAAAPLVQVSDLIAGLQVLKGGDWDYVFSATDFASPIMRAFRQSFNGGIEMFFPHKFKDRSQDLPVAFHDAAQFYWGRPSAWRQKKIIFDKSSTVILLPRWRVQDIDTMDDWVRAECIFNQIRDEKGKS